MSQLNIENKEIENEHIVLDSGTLYFLGPNLTLRGCTLVLKSTSRDLVFVSPRLIDCAIDVKRRLKGAHWENALLKGCRFIGKLSGSDFGRWPDLREGHIEGCDFGGAELDECRFLDCDITTLRLPRWPCFTILRPLQRSQELKSVQWPGTVPITIGALLKSPPFTAGVTYFASALAKRSGTTEAEIRAALDGLGGVVL